MTRFVMALVCTGLLAFAASADDEQSKQDKGKGKGKGQRNPAALFKKLDANDDGKLSADEFKQFASQRPLAKGGKGGPGDKGGKGGKGKGQFGEQLFKRLDTNTDGFLSQEEFSKVGQLRGQAPGKGKDKGKDKDKDPS